MKSCRLFYQFRVDERNVFGTDTKAIFDRLAALKVLEKEDLEKLKTKIPEEKYSNTEKVKLMLEQNEVSVLYIGGDETFKKMANSVESSLVGKFPKLNLSFIHPGWSSNWNVTFENLKNSLPKFDVLVLNPHVRTMFGRKVRAECTDVPWFACTGKGRKSLARSIEAAAMFVAEKKFLNPYLNQN